MRCIFCKSDSTNSKSVEHIIPESLCEQHWILSKGVVCDKCNNYFSRKIEKPFLESDEFKYLRFRQDIKSKKGKIPAVNAFCDYKQVRVYKTDDPYIHLETDDPKVLAKLISGKTNQIILPVIGKPPTEQQISRFIAKMAVEYLADRVKNISNWNEDFIQNEQLKEIINYVRYPKKNQFWEYTKRKVYDENSYYVDTEQKYQTLNEMDLIVTNYEKAGDNYNVEIYFVIIIFGTEYAINLAGSNMENYKKYLKKNNFVSPLYFGKYKDNIEKNGSVKITV